MVEKTIEKLLYEHIKNLDYHSARESRRGDACFIWHTPVMNEFIAFGEVVKKNVFCKTCKEFRETVERIKEFTDAKEQEIRKDAENKMIEKIEKEFAHHMILPEILMEHGQLIEFDFNVKTWNEFWENLKKEKDE